MIFAQISKIIDPIAVKLDRWTLEGYRLLPNLIMAVLIMVVFRALARYGGRFMERILGHASQNIALVSLISAITRIAIFTTGLFFALGVLGLDKTVTSLLAGAGVLALALGFAFQDLTTNFISGAFIAIQRPIKVGDIIETNGFIGKVLSIGLRSVKLDNFAGQIVELPSKDIFQKPIVNFTNSGERRVQVECSIGYKDDLSIVENLALSAMKDLNFLNPLKPIELNFMKFSEKSIDFEILFWINQDKIGPGPAKSIVMKAVKRVFDEHNIAFPTPVRPVEQVPTGRIE
ncbi:mechanosensitive ion channel family protein [Dyadobacter pollutisoli]|uniref:Mechanosensitive ion channel family protein n=1 Tax=Dyadobacter pollutisoli TaxID=2910158 RepID=A0A9E8NCL1_9BACT|nr:mechanosensitive ion channel family protein [Dyadobacter pollutisoli]WAC11799.1 mechanosensitive ion channel family protein [Dyadobacter pollutisoli]